MLLQPLLTFMYFFINIWDGRAPKCWKFRWYDMEQPHSRFVVIPFEVNSVVWRSTFPSTFRQRSERDYQPEAANFFCDDNDAPKQDFSVYRTTIADLVFYLFNKTPIFIPVMGHWPYICTDKNFIYL